MPETLSPDIRTGYDSQTAFDIKLDTFNTMREVFNRPTKGFGIDYFDPIQGAALLSGQQQQAPQPPIDFETAMTSKDPKVRDLALSALEKDAHSNPYGRFNVGKEFRTPFNRGVDKFIDDKYGFDMFSDNEDFYYRNSYMDDGWFMRAMKNVLWRFPSRVAVGAATKFVEGVGYLGSMVVNGVVDGAKALAGKEANYWEDVADNTLSKVMRDLNEDFKDFVVPVYKQAGFDEKGFFSQLGNYAFWNDSFADGVAFMASMFIPAGIASKAGLLGKGASLGAQVAGDAGLAARATGALRAGLRGATGASTYGEAGLTIFNVANEAAFQATGQYSETKQMLLDERAQGKNTYTDREIQELSGKAAASSFGWNFPALMVSGAWEMKNIIKPIIGRTKNTGINTTRTILEDTGHVGFKQYTNKTVNYIANSRIGKVASFYAPKAAKGSLVEGFWEENIQNAIDRAGRGQYTRYGDDTDSAGVIEKARGGFFGILEQYVSQTIDTLKGNDRENAISVGIGELLGVGGGIVGSKFGRRIIPGATVEKDGRIVPQTSFFIGERKQQQLATNLAVSETNNIWNNFLSIQDIRKPDGTIDEAKLATKVAAFESFAARQEILDDLKENKSYPEHELKMLENRLLNDYVKGLAKVDKVQDAVGRFQALANREVDSKGEKFLSNPLEVSQYISKLGELYEQGQKKPDHVSSEYTPAQLQQINEAIKDRWFDLMAERAAIEPVLRVYEKDVSDSLTSILDFLQNDKSLPQGEFIEQGLARSRAREYIEAIAKKEAYTGLLDQDSPEFLKEYHRSKIKEADEEVKKLNADLGENAPTIENGKVTFNDKVIDFKSKLLVSLLDAYKAAYSDKANLEFMQQHNEFIAAAITKPNEGLQNWNDYLEYVSRAIAKSKLPTEQKYKVGEKEYTKATLDAALASGEITQVQYDEAIKTPVTTETEEDETEEDSTEDDETTTTTTADEDQGDVTEDDVNTDEKTGGKAQRDDIDPDSALSWYTPLKSSTDDTVEVNSETERLKDAPYDEVRKLAIRKLIVDPTVNDKYKFFIVKDTFPEIYKSPANNEQRDEELVPTGEVIIMETLEGKPVTINDVFPGKYKDMANMPLVFSFEQEIFRNYLVAERASIWADKMKATTNEAYEFYDQEQAKGQQAREIIKKDGTAKIQVTIIEATDGIMPTTNVVPVIERFGEDFEVSVKTIDSKEFKKGTIVATFGKVSFAVGTAQLQSNATELVRLEKVIGNGRDIPPIEFENYEAANQVRNQYLNTMFYTDKENQNFGIVKVGEKYKIIFQKLDKKDKDLPKEQKIKAMKQSFAYGELRFNVSNKATKDGMNVFSPEDNGFIRITPEEYQTFIKTKVVTSLKKTVDKDGNLYMKPVNAYFSFNIADTRISKPDDTKAVQKKNFDAIVAKIKQQVDSQTLTPALIDAHKKKLNTLLANKTISQDQFNKLNERLGELKAELKKKPAAKPAPVPPKAEKKSYDEQVKKSEEVAKKIIEIEARRKKDIDALNERAKAPTRGFPMARDLYDKDLKTINDKYNAEILALVPSKEVKLPAPKTEQVEDEEEKRAKEAKAKMKEKQKADVSKTVGTPTSKAEDTQYTIMYNGVEMVLNTNNGYIYNPLRIGGKVRNVVVNKDDKGYGNIMKEMAKVHPYQKAEDGTIKGIFTSQLEGEDMTITAYGLPIVGENDVFIDETGKAIISTNPEGVEVSSVEFVKTLLTDKGRVQLNDFLARNCR